MSCTLLSGKKNRYIYLMVFILFFISYGYFFQGGGWNQNSRICLTRAILRHHSFTIDSFKEDAREMAFVNTGDWAFYNGHYYSNKAPGLSLLAVPFYALAEYLMRSLVPDDGGRQVLLSAYFSTLCTTVLFSSLLCLLMFYVFHHFFHTGIGNALLATLLFGFGTLAFSYSTTFYSHQPAAFFSFLSFVVIMQIRQGSVRHQAVRALVAGVSAGVAVLIEPSTLFIGGTVAVYLASSREGRRYLPLFIAGGIPAGVVQGFYNTMCFGHPLASGYQYANDLVMWKVEGKLFGIPHPARFFQLLCSPYRGLLFSSPVLLMALPGVFIFLRNRQWRAEALCSIVVSVLMVVLIASFHAWHGGSAAGPRYLLPAFPFFYLLAGVSLVRFPKLYLLVGTISLLINLSITVVGNEIPRDIRSPFMSVVVKRLLEGRVSINPVPFSHFGQYDIYELARIENWSSIVNYNSFNLGEIFFPHSLASILPLICFWSIWGCGWRRVISTQS